MPSLPPSENQDHELMRRLAGDDQQALMELVEKYQQPLLNFFYSMGVYNDAEDLVQDTFIHLYKARKTYREQTRFKGYLFTVARRVRIDWVRKQVRRKKLKEEAAGQPAEPFFVEPRGIRLDLQQALDRLPETLRTAVVLKVSQGFKYDEIAAMLNIPVGTAKSRVHNGLRQLKEQWHELRT